MRTELHKNWIVSTVGDLILRHFNGPSPTCEERQIASNNEWGLLKTTAITWMGWDWTKHKVPPESFWRNYGIEVHKDDLLVTKAGPRHRVGVVVWVNTTPPQLMVSGKMIGLRPNQEAIVPSILAGLLSLPEPQKYIDHRTTGMAESQVNFSNETLLSTSLFFPPLPEQRKIAEVLDTVDDAIRKTEALIAKLKAMKQGLLHDLLTRGLDDNGELRDPDRHPEQFKDSPLGRIPKAWEVGPLGNQFTLQRGFDITVAEQRPGNIPVVSSSGISSYHDKAMVNGPGVVTGRKGKLGDAYYLEGPFWPHDTSLWVKDFHGNLAKFGAIFIQSLRLERFDAATSVPTLNRNFIHPMTVAVPLWDEQVVIVERVEAHDDRILSEEAARDKLIAMKKGLMEDLLTGRVRVNT